VTRTLALLALCAAGCSDVFALSIANNGGDGSAGGGDMDTSMPGDDLGGGGTGGDGGGVTLPAACARLSCVPAMNEGDVQLDDNSGTISGCHAYKTLTITNTVRATQFLACADTINIGGAPAARSAARRAADTAAPAPIPGRAAAARPSAT